VLSVFLKILEKLMYNRLLSFLKRQNILSEAQHGFREKESIETASQLFMENVQEALDNQKKSYRYFFGLIQSL
jgi:hypothetical protein